MTEQVSPPPPGAIPKRVGLALQLAAVLVDVLVIACGAFTLADTPASIQEAGILGSASIIWSGALIVGGLAAAVGAIGRLHMVHTVGAFLTSSGFLIWCVAAMNKPDPTAQTYAVACLLGAATVLSIWRGLGVAAGSALVEHEG